MITTSLVTGFLFTTALAIYPFAIYPFLLRLLKEEHVGIDYGAQTDGSQFCLLFCAHNEERSLNKKLNNLRALKEKYPNLQILAYDDDSSDHTRHMLLNSGIADVFYGTERTGKAAGMKLLASKSDREYLVFTDANVVLDVNAIATLAKVYADSSIGGVCGTLLYVSSESTATAEVGSLYWRLEEHIKGLESRSGNVMGADGSIFSVRSHLYPNFPDNVLDDFSVSMSVIFQGLRLVKSNDVIAYENLVTRRDEEFLRKIRISARAITTHRSFGNQIRRLSSLDRFKYYSHKVLRWYSGFFLAISATQFFLLVAYFASVVIATLGIAALAALTYFTYGKERGPVSSILEVFAALLATSIGVIQAYRKRDYTVWNPSSSRSE